MSLRHARATAVFGLSLLAFAASANAAVLWDQSAISFNPNAPGIVNSKLTGFGGGNFYTVNDVTVPAGGWTINSITEYFSDWAGVDMNIKAPSGNLIVMAKTGALPVGAPTLTSVPLVWTDTIQSGQGVYVMVTSGLNIALAPGDYWIGVAPTQAVDSFNGNNSAWPALNKLGNDCATYGNPSWAGLYSGYDSAFKVEGVTGGATPTATSTWGGLKALYR
jgi:hypothetical protein